MHRNNASFPTGRLDPDSDTCRTQQDTKAASSIRILSGQRDHLHLSTPTTSVSSQTSLGACLTAEIRMLPPKRKSVIKCENVYDIGTELYRRRTRPKPEASSVWQTPKKQTRCQPKIRLREPLRHTICEGRFDSSSLTRARFLSWDVAKSTGERVEFLSNQVPREP